MTKGSKTYRDESEWHEVTEALNALGASITRASATTTTDDENRRHMRELAEGLAALALRLEAAAGAPPFASEPELPGVETPVAQPAPREAASPAVDVPPAMLSAFQVAHQRFRAAEAAARPEAAAATVAPASDSLEAQVAEQVVTPVEQAEQASVTGSFKAVIAEKVTSLLEGVATRVGVAGVPDEQPDEQETSIQEWLFPEGAAETKLQLDNDLEPARGMPETAGDHAANVPNDGTAGEAASAPAAAELGPSEALRIAHERFKAERKAAEDAAEKARSRAASRRAGRHAKGPTPPSDDEAAVW